MSDKLKHYKWYDDPDFPDDYDVCYEHPTLQDGTLCGGNIGETPDGNPEKTDEQVNCKFCLKVVKTIKELINV